MGKMGASSWLSAVKKALSPTKESERTGEQEEEDRKKPHLEKNLGGFVQKRGRNRWIFRKPLPYERTIEHNEDKNIASSLNNMATRTKGNERGKLRLKFPRMEEVAVPEQRQAMATRNAAKLVVSTAQDTMEVIRLTTPSIIVAENYAAVTIQAAFRGYLAKRALKALKGVVQLQAFIRGYNVRKRAKMTLQCMQSLLWVQNQVCDQRKRLSLSPIKHLYQITDIKTNSRCSSRSITDDEYHPHKTKDANLKRDNSLAHTFSRQIWRRESHQIYLNKKRQRHTPSSPAHTTGQNLLVNSLSSPHRSRTRAMKEQSPASPPPRYMAETESVAARVRSQSAPRQRPSLERVREIGFSAAKKRLSFAVPDDIARLKIEFEGRVQM